MFLTPSHHQRTHKIVIEVLTLKDDVCIVANIVVKPFIKVHQIYDVLYMFYSNGSYKKHLVERSNFDVVLIKLH